MSDSAASCPPRRRNIPLRALLSALVLLWGSSGWAGPAPNADDEDDGDAAIQGPSFPTASGGPASAGLSFVPEPAATLLLATVLLRPRRRRWGRNIKESDR
jgi:hypothetical protein